MDAELELGRELAEWGKVLLLETRGRRSGRPVETPVGFVEEADGSLLVSAATDAADWARNLREEALCRATREGVSGRYRALELEGADHARAVTGLILKYGTPAERLGAGPAFRLVPTAPSAGLP